jgi:hypothetical protein
MAPVQRFLLSDRQRQRTIHAQRGHGSAPNVCNPRQADAVPAEMNPPGIPTWMEQRHFFAAPWVDRGLTCSLAQRAGHTSEREVIQESCAARGCRNDVVEMKNRFLTFLRQAAILTTEPSSLFNLAPQNARDGHALGTIPAQSLRAQPQQGQ